jgi:hypothetical protein
LYRDVLGLPDREAYSSENGRVTILEAGRATLELLDPTHAAFVDEVEVGRRVAGQVRLAFEVDAPGFRLTLARRRSGARGCGTRWQSRRGSFLLTLHARRSCARHIGRPIGCLLYVRIDRVPSAPAVAGPSSHFATARSVSRRATAPCLLESAGERKGAATTSAPNVIRAPARRLPHAGSARSAAAPCTR